MLKLAFMLLSLLARVKSECKDIKEYDDYDKDKKNWFCSHTYYGYGYGSLIQGCTLQNKTLYANEDFSVNEAGKYEAPSWGIKAIPVGSVVVLPGCTLYAFEVCTNIHKYQNQRITDYIMVFD